MWVFGCHMAHCDHGHLTGHDLDHHFNRWIFRSHRQPIELDAARQTSDGMVSTHERFYSDNNSCLRKSIWTTLPLPDVVYGEDQLWAREILRKGFKKAYAQQQWFVIPMNMASVKLLYAPTRNGTSTTKCLAKDCHQAKKMFQMVETSCANDRSQRVIPKHQRQ